MSSEQKPLQGIDTVIIRVSDIVKSKEWYTTKLGLTVVWEDDSIKLVVFDTGGTVSLTIWQTGEKIAVNIETASYPIFRVDDADSARE